ncbi:hypothetical protein [Desulfosporosinus hippei]|uniref:Uracil DNA glycosylase superfamily protein n=1 Tax=Desulfosporosinus hippei DSM 8344 TaxID=1121419 RepID=A0A1G8EIF2_9FIRM|nr:hypothetical protein [Desulfosporosinus hippei]SDH69703.1 hypothetical protein SAMN05443529_11734 [Desulfosporosinus hippei DSM 8344]
MTDSTLSRDLSLTDQANGKSGEMIYPIWLLFNPKHPAVRHYIWTPVLAEIQDQVYRELRKRIDSSKIYTRFAVSDSSIVPNTLNWWDAKVAAEIANFREFASLHKPKILISFGAFPFEFLRRVYAMKPEKGPKSWGTTNLGDEFIKSIEHFDLNKTNIFPLLRRVVESDKYIDDLDYTDKYFKYVGTNIARRIIEHKDQLNIWMD